MKKIFFLLSFFLGFSAFSQSYTPLLDELNEWQFTTCYFGCITDVYYTDGDTIVSGKNYKILDGYHYINRNLLLREDVTDKKVFLTVTNPQYIEDLLLYDFSLTEGDSIQMRNPLSPFPTNGGYFMLDSIRSLTNVNGDDKKHFYFTPTETNTTTIKNSEWVEGVGSLSMINAPGGEPNINQVGRLSCAFKDSELFYSNLDSISACNPFNLSVSEVIYSHPEIELFSQPERNWFLLTNTADVIDVSVYGINGKMYKKTPSYHYDEVKLDLSDLRTGIYILKIKLQDGKVATFKVVVE